MTIELTCKTILYQNGLDLSQHTPPAFWQMVVNLGSRFIAVHLDPRQPHVLCNHGDFRCRAVHKHANLLHFTRQLTDDLLRLLRGDSSFAGCKNKAQRIGACIHRLQRVFKTGSPTDFNPGMHTSFLWKISLASYWTVPRQ